MVSKNNPFINTSGYVVKNKVLSKEVKDPYFYFKPDKKNDYDPDISGYTYIFMTKPNLNIESLISKKNTFYGYPYELYHQSKAGQRIIQTMYNSAKPQRFIPLISNMFSSFSTQDSVLTTQDRGENLQGFKIKTGDKMSDGISGELAIDYKLDSDIGIIKLHKLWVDYIDLVTRGYFYPEVKNIESNIAPTLDYASSLYVIRTKPDAETITFYSKYTGVFPTSIPYSSMSYAEGEFNTTTASVNYVYSFKEDMDPEIIGDFNNSFDKKGNSTALKDQGSRSKDLKSNTGRFGSIGETASVGPTIVAGKNNEYKLKF